MSSSNGDPRAEKKTNADAVDVALVEFYQAKGAVPDTPLHTGQQNVFICERKFHLHILPQYTRAPHTPMVLCRLS